MPMIPAQPSLSEQFVDTILRQPKRSLLAGVLLVLSLAVGIPRLTSDFTHTAFFYDDDPLLLEFNRFEEQFGNDGAVVVVVHSPSGVFDVDTGTLLQELTDGLWHIPDVIRVDSLANHSWVHATEDDISVEPFFPDDTPLTPRILDERKRIALLDEVLVNYMISEDGKTALAYARIRPAFEDPPDPAVVVNKVRELLDSLQRTDHEFHITGAPAVVYSFQESAQHDVERLVPIVWFIAVLFLVCTLRSVGGVILPFAVTLCAVAAALGAGGYLGVEITSITVAIPQVLIGVALADSIHILSVFYRAQRAGLAKEAALRHTLMSNLRPTILTSLSTAIGFVAFSTSRLPPILGLGVLAAIGTLVAWWATYLVLGPLLMLSRDRKTNQAAPPRERGGAWGRFRRPPVWIARYARGLERYRWPIIVFSAALCVGAFTLAAKNTVNSDPYKYFAEDYPLRKAQDFVIDKLGGAVGFEVSIYAGKEDGILEPPFLRTVEAFERDLLAMPGISKAVSVLDIFRQTNRALNGDAKEAYVLPDSYELASQEFLLYTMGLPQGMDVNHRVTIQQDAIRLTLISDITDSATWKHTSETIEAMGRELGLTVLVSGKGKLYQSMNGYVTRSFVRSVFVAVILISLILIYAFRSVRLGLLAMIPNLIPLILGGAALKLIGHTLDIGTVLVSSVCLGIAVDDTIHMLDSYEKYSKKMSARDAVAMALTHTGPALVITTLVLVASFGTLAFATFVPNVYFGIMTAIILVAALVTDLTFLPAMLLALARRNSRQTKHRQAS